MKTSIFLLKGVAAIVTLMTVVSCASMHDADDDDRPTHTYKKTNFNDNYEKRLPQAIDTNGKKVVLVDPQVHAWGAYGQDGKLIRAGIATAGGIQCPPDDPDEPTCRTTAGTFKITSLGDGECYSKVYPRPEGGGLMPYCMYFNKGQALHGSPDPAVVEANVSHGCVRMRIPDAEWMRNNFAQVGTVVKVLPYD